VGVRVDGEDLVAVLARSEATAARKAARLHSAHDTFAADEKMRAAGVRHSAGADWMAMRAGKAARTQSLLARHVRVSSSPAPAPQEEIAAEKRKARELEREWMLRRISAARTAEGKRAKAEKSKVDAAMALLHAAQDAKVHQAIDIVHAADHAVRFASTMGLGKKPADTTSAGDKASEANKQHQVGGSAAGVATSAGGATSRSRAPHRAHTLEADVQSLQREVLAKIAEEHAEADGKTWEQLAVAPQRREPEPSSAFEIAAEREEQQLAQQGKVDRAVDLISNPAHVMYEGNSNHA